MRFALSQRLCQKSCWASATQIPWSNQTTFGFAFIQSLPCARRFEPVPRIQSEAGTGQWSHGLGLTLFVWEIPVWVALSTMKFKPFFHWRMSIQCIQGFFSFYLSFLWFWTPRPQKWKNFSVLHLCWYNNFSNQLDKSNVWYWTSFLVHVTFAYRGWSWERNELEEESHTNMAIFFVEFLFDSFPNFCPKSIFLSCPYK